MSHRFLGSLILIASILESGKSGNWFSKLIAPLLNDIGPQNRNLVAQGLTEADDEVAELVDQLNAEATE